MKKEIVIMDGSIARLNARHPLEAGIFFTGFVEGKDTWCGHNKDNGKKYDTINEAVEDARKLRVMHPDQKPPKVFEITTNGNMLNLNDIKY